jgi:hypothetical protein
MCLIWSGLLTNYEYYKLCVLLGEVEIGMVIRLVHKVQEGSVGKTLTLQARPMGETVAKHDILL